MRALCQVLLEEEKTRQLNEQTDWEIPFRPDHGHELLSDSEKKTFPGYPLIGRLRGLAEIRGVIYGLKS
jgi:mannonate dehydratase